MSHLFLLSLAPFFIWSNGYTEFSVAIDMKSCVQWYLFILMVTMKNSVAINPLKKVLLNLIYGVVSYRIIINWSLKIQWKNILYTYI